MTTLNTLVLPNDPDKLPMVPIWNERPDGLRGLIAEAPTVETAQALLASMIGSWTSSRTPSGVKRTAATVDGLMYLLYEPPHTESCGLMYADPCPSREKHPADIRVNRKLNPRKPVA